MFARARTRVPGEQDALSNRGGDSPAGVLARILTNRTARLVATGEDYITGEEADWILKQNGDFPTTAMLEERERAAREAELLGRVPA
jgi:hypothetical protein